MFSAIPVSPYGVQNTGSNGRVSPRYDQLSPRTINLSVIQKYNSAIFAWAMFSTAALAIFYYFSDGDFSFLMTYAALTRCFGFVLLNARIFIKGHAKSVSLKTLQLYAVVFTMRLLSVSSHDGYLPYDRSGDFVYYLTEGASLLLAMSGIILVYTKFLVYTNRNLFMLLAGCCVAIRFSRTYQKDYDTFGKRVLPQELGALVLLVPCVLVAILLHPSLNNDSFSDIAWCLSMYLESCAIIPQLFMFQRSSSNKGVVEVLISHYVFALGLSRVWDMIFWLYSYHELTNQAGSKNVGVLVLATQFIHIAIMADFFYYYIIAMRTGGMMQLPTSMSIV